MESIRTVDINGTIEYLNEKGHLHREDGPAYEYKNGYKEWWINGKRHREDGPAVVYDNGEEYYYLNNIRYYLKDAWEREVISRRLKRIKDL